ncbi:MAG TPA: RNA polymerase sigma factor [Gemmatimonadales bacterium]|nr:RNA polymerase sigma factor [Gemmatimonadales bacterium]
MTEPSDGAVVRQVLAGDTDAYRLLVARHRGRLGRFALQMLGNREDAEEALQDAFVRAYRSLGQCAAPERFDGWLFRILVNRCRTKGARRRRYEATFVADELALAATADPAAERVPSEHDFGGEDLARALSQLDTDSREVFLLKYVEELSYQEMAGLTGAGISALKMRVKRACERLRRILMEKEYV